MREMSPKEPWLALDPTMRVLDQAFACAIDGRASAAAVGSNRSASVRLGRRKRGQQCHGDVAQDDPQGVGRVGCSRAGTGRAGVAATAPVQEPGASG